MPVLSYAHGRLTGRRTAGGIACCIGYTGRAWVGGAVIGAVFVAGASGCNSSAVPETPPATPGTTRTSSLTPPAPTFDPVPEAARQRTNDGAIAFARYWIDQNNKAFMHPDLTSLELLCLPTSEACVRLEAQLSELRGSEAHADRPGLTVQTARIGIPEQPGATSVVLDATMQAHNYVDAQGNVLASTSAGRHIIVVTLLWNSGGWKISSTQGRQA